MLKAREESLWRGRNFRLAWLGQTTSNIGTGLLQLAVLLFVYARTHSVSLTTLTFLVETVPVMLISPFAGVLADRIDRRRLAIAADAMNALVLVPLLFSHRLDVLLPVLALQAAISSVFRPAFGALFPLLVPADRLTQANGVTTATWSVLGLVVPSLGAALFATFGFGLVVAIDLATFAVSILMTSATRPRPVESASGPLTAVSTVRAEFAAGVRLIARTPRIRVLVITGLVLGCAEGLLMPVFVPFMQGTLGATTKQVGFAASAQSVGGIAGGLLVALVARRLRASTMYIWGSAGMTAGILAVGVAPSYLAAVVALMFLGIPSTFFQVGDTTLIQTQVPPEFLGRAMGTVGALSAMVVALAGATPLALVPLIGVRGVVIVGGLAAAASSITAASKLRRAYVSQP